MEWVYDLQGQVVGIDSSPFIYYIEAHPSYLEMVQPFFEGVRQGKFRAVTSVVTLLELLVHPYRRNNSQLADEYREILLHSNNITCMGVTTEIAERAAILRSEHPIHTPDAIQMGTVNRTRYLFPHQRRPFAVFARDESPDAGSASPGSTSVVIYPCR